MATAEIVLQIDLFTGDLVDARTSYQKKKDWERSAPSQMQMFSTPDMMQIGVRHKSTYRDWIDRTTITPLIIETEDNRTPEELEFALRREAEKQTIPLFEDTPVSPTAEVEILAVLQAPVLSGVIFDAQCHFIPVGLRAVLRAKSIPVRARIARHSSQAVAAA